MIIDIVPIWVLFLIITVLIMIAVEIGFRLGRNVRKKTETELESPVSAIAGVILGLLAFMLAFTFGIVSDRYEVKKGLVREEANTLRTAWHRADFLQEADRAKSKAIMKAYVDERVAVALAHDAKLAQMSLGSAIKMQKDLWAIAVANGKLDMNSDIGALYVESINDLDNLHATRVGVGLNARIPTGIWFVLFALLLAGMIAVGYHTAIAESRRSRVTPILAISFALVLALIAALDHPGDSLMPVSQQPLVNIQHEMAADLSGENK